MILVKMEKRRRPRFLGKYLTDRGMLVFYFSLPFLIVGFMTLALQLWRMI